MRLDREHGRLLALIGARGGSKGLPGKNIRPLAGMPLIAHSILCACMCPEVNRVIVSTDSMDIAETARLYGAETPFIRPADLGRDDTPMWDVIRHALRVVEEMENDRYDYLVLMDPTVPTRLPKDVAEAYARLIESPEADGIVGVSIPEFNPINHAVVEKDGWMTNLFQEGYRYHRRQDVPAVYQINGSLYIWRTDYVRRQESEWPRGRHLIYEISEHRLVHTDDLPGFERAEILLENGIIKLPWLAPKGIK